MCVLSSYVYWKRMCNKSSNTVPLRHPKKHDISHSLLVNVHTTSSPRTLLLRNFSLVYLFHMWYHTTSHMGQTKEIKNHETFYKCEHHSSSCLYQQMEKAKPKIFRRVLRAKGIKTPQTQGSNTYKTYSSSSKYLKATEGHMVSISWEIYVPSASEWSINRTP